MKNILRAATSTLIVLCGMCKLAANPIVATYFTELKIDASGGWSLEIYSYLPVLFRSSALHTMSSTVTLISGTSLKVGYNVIGPDNLTGSLLINTQGDSLILQDSSGVPSMLVVFGNAPGSWIAAPLTHQSICTNGSFWYLDNTPTLGRANDTTNAIGYVRGKVKDVNGQGLVTADVAHMSDHPPEISRAYTDYSGNYIYRCIAQHELVSFHKSGFVPRNVYIQVRPETTITIDVTLIPANAVRTDREPDYDRDFSLFFPYPNPFNPIAQIGYALKKPASVVIEVFRADGRMVSELVSGRCSPGNYLVQWDASKEPSGIYLVRLSMDGKSQTRKCLLLR